MKVSMKLNGSRLALRLWNPETLASSCVYHAQTDHHSPLSQTRISCLSCRKNSLQGGLVCRLTLYFNPRRRRYFLFLWRPSVAITAARVCLQAYVFCGLIGFCC